MNPVETLQKMLQLEEAEYAFQDRAVAGGLARYADTWSKQATQLYGEAAQVWIAGVAALMRSYSAAPGPEARREIFTTLKQHLQQGPEAAQRPDLAKGAPEAPVEARPAETRPAAQSPVRPTSRSATTSWQVLQAPLVTLRGVGQARAALLEKLGLRTLEDLLFCYPRRYEDYAGLKTIMQLEFGEWVTVIGKVWDAGARETQGGRKLFKAVLSDNTGFLELTWFNQPYLADRIKSGMLLKVTGKVGQYLGRPTMVAPEWEPVEREELKAAGLLPVYPLTEGLTQKVMRSIVEQALNLWAERVPETLSDTLRQRYQLWPLSQALRKIHFPEDHGQLRLARRRLAFEEALILQIGLLRQKRAWKAQPGQTITLDPAQVTALIEALPYTLTGAQQRSLNEMLQDLASGQPMNRLLQGDVGSGKTVVAALLLALLAGAGYQGALMVPTEILAEQHYATLSRLFAAFPQAPTLALLTGSTPEREREAIYAGLADGSISVVVGTHALIQDRVTFARLALVVIDEQHRFGVEQRAALRAKGLNPHVLVMTATPIPRSLELTVWGHVDVSVLDELPPGRQPVETRVLKPYERERAYQFIQHQIEKGRQAFIVYPLVEESEKLDARAAVEEFERLRREVFPRLRLGLLHGQMRSEEKEAVMAQMKRGELDILVATTVIEVGIDIPNATVMLVDGAERFGLAQLHQLRGRVGRGAERSYCLLLSEDPSEEAAERLKALESTTDGFLLAQKDLEMRGPGEFLGTRQSGWPDLPILMVVGDTRVLHEAREAALGLLDEDPDLVKPENQALAQRVARFWQGLETVKELS